MKKIVFIKTDPTFLIAEDMVGELRSRIGRLQILGTSSITMPDFIHGNDALDNGLFPKWYDFARTAGTVLRHCMLLATGMAKHFDPNYSQLARGRNISAMAPGTPAWGEMIDMAANELEARHLAAEFDRLYPHFAIENFLRGIRPGEVRLMSSLMYVVDMENNLLFQIMASMTITFVGISPSPVGSKPHLMIHAKPYVAAFRVGLPSLSPIFDRPLFPKYFWLYDLIKRHIQTEMASQF